MVDDYQPSGPTYNGCISGLVGGWHPGWGWLLGLLGLSPRRRKLGLGVTRGWTGGAAARGRAVRPLPCATLTLCSGINSCQLHWITGNHVRQSLLQKKKFYPVWPHRQGDCLACWRLKCRFPAERDYTDLYEALTGYCPWGWGVRPVN